MFLIEILYLFGGLGIDRNRGRWENQERKWTMETDLQTILMLGTADQNFNILWLIHAENREKGEDNWENLNRKSGSLIKKI